MKKVIHLLATGSYSGAENVACTIINSTSEWCNSFYCSPNGKIESVLENKNIKYIPLKRLSFVEISKIIKKVDPDIIHAHDFKASIVMSLIRFKGKKISHIHKNDPKMKKLSIKSILFLILSYRFSSIIGVSDSIINEYIFKDSIKNKFHTLYNYIDKNYIINKSNDEYNNHYDLCFFGRLAVEKNPLDFINIVIRYKEKYNKNIKACIIGTGALENECMQQINNNELTNNISMLGFQDNPYKIIKNCKCIIMPSLFEGFGITAVESSILNIPVLNSGVGGLKDIFSKCEFLICNDIDEYVRKAYLLINNEKKITMNIEKYTNIKKWTKIIKECYEDE